MQVTHLRQYAEMLRMQTHEFANKLSSLSGLLQLGHVDQAVELIQQESEACQTMLHDLLRAIEDKPVAGLILGKFSRARELGVELVLDPDSALGEYPAAVSADLITLIGNLLDNGIRAAWARRKQCPPRVLISLNDFGRRLVIEVEDSGEGWTRRWRTICLITASAARPAITVSACSWSRRRWPGEGCDRMAPHRRTDDSVRYLLE